MKINPNLEFLRENYAKKRIIVLQGGTRSGKTYSAIQFLIELCYKFPNAGMVITIARATYPAIRGSVLRDFIDILSGFDAYDPRNHNKTESTYQLEGNMVEFISLDQPQKVRGRKGTFYLSTRPTRLLWKDGISYFLELRAAQLSTSILLSLCIGFMTMCRRGRTAQR